MKSYSKSSGSCCAKGGPVSGLTGKRHGGTLTPVAQTKVATGGGQTQQGGKRHGKTKC